MVTARKWVSVGKNGAGEGSRNTRTRGPGPEDHTGSSDLRVKMEGGSEGFQTSMLEVRYRIWKEKTVQDSEVTFATARFL